MPFQVKPGDVCEIQHILPMHLTNSMSCGRHLDRSSPLDVELLISSHISSNISSSVHPRSNFSIPFISMYLSNRENLDGALGPMYWKTIKFLHIICQHLALVKVSVGGFRLLLHADLVTGIVANSNFGFRPIISLASCIAGCWEPTKIINNCTWSFGYINVKKNTPLWIWHTAHKAALSPIVATPKSVNCWSLRFGTSFGVTYVCP